MTDSKAAGSKVTTAAAAEGPRWPKPPVECEWFGRLHSRPYDLWIDSRGDAVMWSADADEVVRTLREMKVSDAAFEKVASDHTWSRKDLSESADVAWRNEALVFLDAHRARVAPEPKPFHEESFILGWNAARAAAARLCESEMFGDHLPNECAAAIRAMRRP